MIKRPRQRNEAHLKFIRELPCLVCLDNTSTEAAHIRYGQFFLGKRGVGTGEKPDDIWTVPLCGRCHREQHSQDEHAFWGKQQPYVRPTIIALALWAHT